GSGWQLASYLLEPPVSVWFFDVGQGDAILFMDRQGRSVLIDGGRTGQGFSVLIPALDALGINQVDLVIATHAHDDHIGGLIELADYGRIRQLVMTRGLYDAIQNLGSDALDAESGGLAELIRLASDAGYGVRTVAAHDTMALGETIFLTVLAPPDDPLINPEAIVDGNAWSLLLLAEVSGQSLLLTADCTADAEMRLVEQQAWPQADVLKVAHHGSAYTTQAAMLAQVRPKVAVISVGANWYGHPADTVLERLQDSGCPVFRTDESGAVHIRFSSDRLDISEFSAH
ncbi:MAG: MBL fold metallo-hydrolase, partial [Bacillota bacterium]|nr:MBL fold metallo-hydrolase [Bacillota bacterium]